MSDKPAQDDELKQYADGWITERKNTNVPPFLKFAYIVIISGCTIYFLLYMNGETTHSERGPLVQQLNAATQNWPPLMYFIAGLVVIYLVVVSIFAFKKHHEE